MEKIKYPGIIAGIHFLIKSNFYFKAVVLEYNHT